MHWPQLLILAGTAFSFALHCQKAGETRTYSPVGYLIDAVFTLFFILFQGGFFAVWGWTP